MFAHNFKQWVEVIEPIVATLSDLVWGPPYPLNIINWHACFLVFSTRVYSI